MFSDILTHLSVFTFFIPKILRNKLSYYILFYILYMKCIISYHTKLYYENTCWKCCILDAHHVGILDIILLFFPECLWVPLHVRWHIFSQDCSFLCVDNEVRLPAGWGDSTDSDNNTTAPKIFQQLNQYVWHLTGIEQRKKKQVSLFPKGSSSSKITYQARPPT